MLGDLIGILQVSADDGDDDPEVVIPHGLLMDAVVAGNKTHVDELLAWGADPDEGSQVPL